MAFNRRGIRKTFYFMILSCECSIFSNLVERNLQYHFHRMMGWDRMVDAGIDGSHLSQRMDDEVTQLICWERDHFTNGGLWMCELEVRCQCWHWGLLYLKLNTSSFQRSLRSIPLHFHKFISAYSCSFNFAYY